MNTGLQSEIKQTKPFGSLRHEVYLSLVRTSALLQHDGEEGMKQFGVTSTQYNVLRILRGAGPDGLCRNEVKARMVKPVPDATRLLDRLEEAGYVVRTRGSEDRRFVTARITGAGLELLERMEQPVADALDRQLGHLTDEEMQQLVKLLQRAREGLG